MGRIIKKFFSLIGSAVLVLIVSGFLSLKPIAEAPAQAHHEDGNPCKTATMTPGKNLTDAMPSEEGGGRQGGIADSGQLDFNRVDHEFAACLEQQAITRTLSVTEAAGGRGTVDITAKFLRGWTWNTNLGYISFSCENGGNYGFGNCGDINYGAFVNPAVDGPEKGLLSGFAWGDNIGWLSMGCNNGRNVGVACGRESYGVRIVQTGDDMAAISAATNCRHADGAALEVGDLYGYGWSDTVGWLNFCGAHLESGQDLEAFIDYEVISSDNSGKAYSNNTDAHLIKIHVLENGQPIVPDRTHQFDIRTRGMVNTVKSNQVTCPEVSLPDCPADAITESDMQNYDPDGNFFFYKISSLAPTDENNIFSIETITVRLYDDRNRTIKLFELPVNKQFEFAPDIEITQINAVDDAGTPIGEGISIFPESSQRVDFQGIRHTAIGTRRPGPFENYKGGSPPDDQITVIRQLYDCSENEYDFVFDADGDGAVLNEERALADENDIPLAEGEVGSSAATTAKNGACAGNGAEGLIDVEEILFAENDTSSYIFAFYDPDAARAAAIQVTNATSLQTIIKYHNFYRDIMYFSKGVTDGSIVNQAADIRGSVRIDIVDTSGLPATDKINQSIGQRAQSKREMFTRAIQSTLRTQAANHFDDNTNQAVVNNEELLAAGNQKGILYYKRRASFPGAPEAPCQIILDDAEDIALQKNVTLVTYGCDIFIDQNIIGGEDAPGRLGIIALEDLRMRGIRKGGNVYLCSRVTDVEANFVLDGTLFSYGESEAVCGANKTALVDQITGLPEFAGAFRSTLRRQLAITGSLVGNNTYGGSLAMPPLLGTGKKAVNAQEKADSRWYDLNFMRYANIEEEIEDGEPTGNICWAAGVTLSRSLGAVTCDVNNPNTSSIVNIIYREPASDMPVFKTVKGR